MAIFWLKRIFNGLPVRVTVQPNDTKNPLLRGGNGVTLPGWTAPQAFEHTIQFQAGHTFWLEPGGMISVDDFAIPWQPHWLKFGGDDLGSPGHNVNTNHVAQVNCGPQSDGLDYIHLDTPTIGVQHYQLGPTGPFHQMVGDLVLGEGGTAQMVPHPGTQGDAGVWSGLNVFANYLSGMILQSAKPVMFHGGPAKPPKG